MINAYKVSGRKRSRAFYTIVMIWSLPFLLLHAFRWSTTTHHFLLHPPSYTFRTGFWTTRLRCCDERVVFWDKPSSSIAFRILSNSTMVFIVLSKRLSSVAEPELLLKGKRSILSNTISWRLSLDSNVDLDYFAHPLIPVNTSLRWIFVIILKWKVSTTMFAVLQFADSLEVDSVCVPMHVPRSFLFTHLILRQFSHFSLESRDDSDRWRIE